MNRRVVKTISCRELYEASLNGPIDLVDVRTPEEFQQVRAAMARNAPLDRLDPAEVIRTRSTPADEPLYFICAVGARSEWACELMMNSGHENVVNVEGGTQEWWLTGLPIEQN
jgi:rhodanese-related sulfurtransferase